MPHVAIPSRAATIRWCEEQAKPPVPPSKTLDFRWWDRRFRLSVLGIALILTGCGYVGDPLPPALNIPLQIKDLSAVQRGNKLIVGFSIPAKTTEGLPVVSVEEVQVIAGPNDAAQFNVDVWAATARHLKTDKLKPGPVDIVEPIAGWQNKEVIVAVRLVNHKGRASQWSNLVIVPIVAPPVVPANIKAEATLEGVRLTWTASGATSYRIFRGNEDLAKTDKAEYLDKDTQFGKEYVYTLQAAMKAGETEAESELSAPLTFTPRDTFPPATPSGASAIAGTTTIELNWERNTEADFKSYRVYRAGTTGDFAVIADNVEAPAFSDRAIKAGTAYRYAITAVDQTGNESPKSNVVEITAP